MKNILKILFSLIFWIISFQNVFACSSTEVVNWKCPDWSNYVANTEPQDVQDEKWKTPIQCGEGWLAWAGCSVNINKLVWVKGAQDWVESRKNLFTFTTDAVSGLTLFIWTLVLIALIYSWFLYVMAGWDEKQAEKWKNWIKNSIIWLILVLLSYTIIRAVQYFANWS